MNPGKNPAMIVILNFIVGIMVSNGLVPGEHKDYLVETLSEIVGLLIILATSIYSLVHYFKIHKLSLSPQKPQELVSAPSPTPPVVETPVVETPLEVRENPSGLPPEMLQ
jgi:hypothetical protein